MNPRRRTWLWIAGVLPAAAAALTATPLLGRDWSESALGVDPGQQSSSAEGLIIGALLTAALAPTLLAGREWPTRRVSRNTPGPG